MSCDPVHPTNVLSLSFQTHEEFTYDGYICLASVSRFDTTVVSDALYKNRKNAERWITELLQDQRTLKVVNGLTETTSRLMKNWLCYPIGVVDLKDMYLCWKLLEFDDCLRTCAHVIRSDLKLPTSGEEQKVEKHLLKLYQPSMEFLLKVFSIKQPFDDSMVSEIDWRSRPLTQELVHRSAFASCTILEIFFCIFEKIKIGGLQRALKEAEDKCLHALRYPTPKCHKPGFRPAVKSYEYLKLLKWRTYVAKNFDMSPSQVVTDESLALMSNEIKKLEDVSPASLVPILLKYDVSDDVNATAKLIVAYLENGAELERMLSIICRNCNGSGHTAKFCPKPKDPVGKRAYEKRPENADDAKKQNERRRLNYCAKRNLDPKTVVLRWERK